MTRLVVLAALLTFAPSAHADLNWRTSGTRGSVTAYELDGRTMIERKLCTTHLRTRSVEYAACSARLRDEVKSRMCQRHGRGTHHYYFQVGEGRPYRSSVFCARGD